MTLNEIENRIVGEWAGENILHLGWLVPPEYYSATGLTASKAVGGKFLRLSYTWAHENEPHEGLLLVCFDAKEQICHATWMDSWHQSNKPMALAGKISDAGDLELLGAYQVPNNPDWIWRIVVRSQAANNLQIEMYNRSPEGAEDLAVQAEYERAN